MCKQSYFPLKGAIFIEITALIFSERDIWKNAWILKKEFGFKDQLLQYSFYHIIPRVGVRFS